MMKEYSIKIKGVEGFNPFEHLTQITDENGDVCVDESGELAQVLTVDAQQTWFEAWAQAQGCIPAIHLYEIPNKMGDIKYKCLVYRDYKDAAMASEFNRDAGAIGTGYASMLDTSTDRHDVIVATCQTKARGAALKAAGFGPEVSMQLKKANLQNAAMPEEVAEASAPADADVTETTPHAKPEPEAEQPKEEQAPAEAAPQQPELEPVVEEAAEADTTTPEAEPQQNSEPEATAPEAEDEEDDSDVSDFMSQLLSSGVKVPADQKPKPQVAEVEQDEAIPEAEAEPQQAVELGGKYVITDDDAAAVIMLEPKVGQTLESLGADLCRTLMDNLSDKLPEPMLQALESYVNAA